MKRIYHILLLVLMAMTMGMADAWGDEIEENLWEGSFTTDNTYNVIITLSNTSFSSTTTSYKIRLYYYMPTNAYSRFCINTSASEWGTSAINAYYSGGGLNYSSTSTTVDLDINDLNALQTTSTLYVYGYNITVTKISLVHSSDYDLSNCTASFSGSDSYTYSGTAPTLSLTVSNGSTTLTEGTDYNYSVSYEDGAGINVSGHTATYTITGTGAYSGTLTATKTYTITKAPLSVTADDKSKTVGGTDPELTYTISGFVNGEDESVLSNLSTVTLSRAAGETVGTYTITISGNITATNYAPNYVNGTFTISSGTATISFEKESITTLLGMTVPTNTLTNTGDGVVTYSSSNTAVATVNSSTGAVTCVTNGTAVITATVTNTASSSYANTTASYTVIVADALTLYDDMYKQSLDISSLTDYNGQTVAITYDRQFVNGKYSTVCLPFGVDISNITNTGGTVGTFYTFSAIDLTTSPITVTYTEVTATSLTANTPYIYLPRSSGTLSFTNATISISGEGSAGSTTVGEWQFCGTYQARITWDAATYLAKASSGAIYGFVDRYLNGSTTDRGKFVKITPDNGSYITLFRAYMIYSGSASAKTRAGINGIVTVPDSLTVVFVDKANLQPTATQTDDDAVYNLQGQRVVHPQRGIYIRGGKKYIVK